MKLIVSTIFTSLVLLCAFAKTLQAQDTPPPPPPPTDEEEVFMIVEDSPRFPGCEELVDKQQRQSCAKKKMLEYIYSNLIYPEEARENGIEGQVVIQFIVEKDGTIIEEKLIRDVDGGCGLAALNIVKSMNDMEERWIPGRQRGRAVRVKYTLPIKFKLEDDGEHTIPPPPPPTHAKAPPSPPSAPLPPPPPPTKSSKVLTHSEVDEMPRFPGCEQTKDQSEREICAQQKMLTFIYSNLDYPQKARKNGDEGTVIIQFTILANGSLDDFSVVRQVPGGCSEAALEVVKKMNNMPEKWIPGKKGGIATAVRYTLPVKFKLEKGRN